MRSQVKFIGAVAAVVLGATSAHAGKADDTLRIAKTETLEGADFINTPSAENHIMQQTVFDTLLTYDAATSKFLPLLATSWKQINPTTWEFTLRQDVKFHDGSEFDADDVVFTMNYLGDPNNQFRFKIRYGWLKGAEKVDKYTVRVISLQPDALALAKLATVGQILPSDYFAANKAQFGLKPIGTGPYRVESLDPNAGAKLVRVDKYPQANALRPMPAIKNVFIKHVPDEQARVAELLSGNFDMISVENNDLAKSLKSRPNLRVTPVNGMLHFYLYLDAADRTGTGMFKDARVRQAVSYAIDRDAIRKNLIPGGENAPPITALCVNIQANCDAATVKLEYNPDKAKALLAEAGKAGGFDVELNTRSSEAYIAEAVAGYLHRVGIRAKVKTETEVAYRDQQRNGKIAALIGHFDSLGIPDVGGELPFYFSGDPIDYARDARMTELTKLSSSEMNPEARRKAIGEALDLNNKQAYVLPLSGGPKMFINSADLVIPDSELNGYGAILARLKWK